MCLGVEEDRDWAMDSYVPKMKEELLTKLAKLYAGCVKVPGLCAKVPYRDMVIITSMAQDQGKREELMEVFHQLGLSLHTENELRRILAEAQAHGRAQVTKEYVLHLESEIYILICKSKARGREAASQGYAERPVITVTSTH